MKRLAGILFLSAAFLLSGFSAADAAVKANPKTKTYHMETCQHAKSKGATAVFNTEADAAQKGFAPCVVCFPQAAKNIQASVSSPYVGNPKSKVFHKAGCKVAPKKSPVILQNLLQARKEGFKPCKTCMPPKDAAAAKPAAKDSTQK